MRLSPDDLLAGAAAARVVETCRGSLAKLVYQGVLPEPDPYGRWRRADLEKARDELARRSRATR